MAYFRPTSLLRLVLALALLATPGFTASSSRPAPRTYDTHDYFAIELDSGLYPTLESATDVARALGVELVEQVGELKGHWLARSSKDQRRRLVSGYEAESSTPDHVLERWQALKKEARRHSHTQHHGRRSSHPDTAEASALRSIQHLPIRKRAKRSFDSSLLSLDDFGSSRSDENAAELTYVQTDLGYHDPLLPAQWHLVNTREPAFELNVTGLWGQGVHGEGVHVAIIDDGLDMHSDDLAGNFFAEGSYDFNDHTELPEPRLSDDQHGTRCAGEIAAIPNDVCGVGVAPRSKVAGVRILSGPISDADEAAALNYKYQENDIYSCSWGPPDDGRSMEAPENLILKAIVNGVQNGRDGKGSIFVFAAGNGGGLDDQCNFDGYTNSIFSITIGAMDRKGLHPYYSEMCAAMLAVAPSSGSGDHIHTTDVGKDKCSDTHGGTSAAAPLAVGVVALALQVRPDLTWRDVQHLLVQSAVFFNPDDPDWQTAANGRKFSYKYGYGRIDAAVFIDAVRKWEVVRPQSWFDSPAILLSDPAATRTTRRQELEAGGADMPPQPDVAAEEPTPEAPKGVVITEEGISSTFTVTQDMLDDFNFETLEHVTVRVWIEHQRRGDVEVELISPNGISSVLARQRRFDEANTGFTGWKFMSMKHWGENPIGDWKIIVKDRINPDKVGRFQSWSLQLWGEALDPALAKPWAPAMAGQPDEEQIGSEATPVQKPKPTDHLPDDHGSAEGEATKPGLAEPTGAPGSDNGAEEDIAQPAESSPVDFGTEASGFLGGLFSLIASPFLMFGAGGAVLLVAAGAGGLFWYRARRKRNALRELSAERGDYQPVSDDLPMDDLRRQRVKRTGDDDVFADEATEDEEDESSEATALKYHDSFLEDEDEEKDQGAQARHADAARTTAHASTSHPNSSTSSWQDAGADVSSPR